MGMYKWFSCISALTFLYELFTFSIQAQLAQREILLEKSFLLLKLPLPLLTNFLSLSGRKRASM